MLFSVWTLKSDRSAIKINLCHIDFMDLQENAVLGDPSLHDGLCGINPEFGDFCCRVAGEAWGKPLLSQKFKAMMAVVLDVSHQSFSGPGVPFGTHVEMALKQGASFAEIEELLYFLINIIWWQECE